MKKNCDICGREKGKMVAYYGQTLCDKHYKQIKKYGKAIDNNPRTIYDKNEYRIKGGITEIDLYDKKCNVVATTIIDTEDLEKVKHIKWRLSNTGYVKNNPKYKASTLHLSRLILNTDQFVDHINHDTLDNRKSNLRIVTKAQNQMNTNSRGVDLRENGKYFARIKINQKAIYLGIYDDKEEAYYARWYAEQILFKEFCYPKEEPQILLRRKKEIQDFVNKKVQRL